MQISRNPFFDITITLGLCLLVLGIAGLDSFYRYGDALSNGKKRLESASTLAERGIASSIREADVILRDLVLRFPADELTPLQGAFERPHTLRRLLTEKTWDLTNAQGILIIDRDCRVVHATRVPSGSDLSQDPICQMLKTSALSASLVTPLISTVPKNDNSPLFISLARPIHDDDGLWSGGVIIRLHSHLFETWISNLNIGAHGSASVSTRDGLLLARVPFLPNIEGRTIPAENLSSYMDDIRRRPFSEGICPYDGKLRLSMSIQLDQLPFYLVIGMEKDEIFAEWYERNNVLGMAVIFFTFLILITGRYYARIKLQHYQLISKSTAVECSGDAIIIVNRHGLIEYVNPEFTRMTGYQAEEAIGQNPRILKSGSHPPEFYNTLWHTILKGGNWRGEVINRRKNGDLYPDFMTISPVLNENGQVTSFVAIHRDISERKLLEERLAHMAHFDELTDLPNRALFFDRLERALSESRRSGIGFALLYIDLDGFKAINDHLGHAAGDTLLREISKRLLASVRESDTVARLGGDEFAIILRSLDEPELIENLAEKIIKAVRQAVWIELQPCQVGASIGIARFPDDGGDEQSLLRAADQAMYDAKSCGKNTWCNAQTPNIHDRDACTTPS